MTDGTHPSGNLHDDDFMESKASCSEYRKDACLGNQKQQQRLAEVPQDASNSDGHACKVGVCVPHKHLQGMFHPHMLQARIQAFGRDIYLTV